ncbi:DMT family transporter [Bernardetia sp. Wsw4-3y2]|uniref:DMT family transporter n=1 Tax=Bernardetia sp. Wsw4-3y2 TaxID=3127471 RepID=UPI0030D2AA16
MENSTPSSSVSTSKIDDLFAKIGISKGIIYMLFAIFCFAIMNLIVKMLPHIPAMEIILFRSSVSFVICVVGLKMQKVKGLGTNKKILFLRGLFGGMALFLFFTTIQNIPLASAITLHYLSPIFTAIIAWLILGERLVPLQWLFFLISFIGVTMVKGFDERVDTIYFVMAIAAAFLAGCAYNCIRKLKTSEHPLMVILYFPLVTLPIASLYCIFYEWTMPVGIDWLYLLLIGILTQIAQLYMTKAYQVEEAAKVASVSYTGIVYALGFGFLFFHEVFNIYVAIGIGLMLLGVILNVTFKSKNKEITELDDKILDR